LTADTYHKSKSYVNLAYSLTNVGFLLFALPTNKSIESKGVRITIQLSVIFLILGLSLRLLINNGGFNFYYALLGNFVASLGRSCSTNACTKVSVKWFLPKNRPLVSSILLLGAPLGTILGYQITTFFITTADASLPTEMIKDKMFSLMFYEGIILIIMVIPAIVFYKDDPPTPTSSTSVKMDRDSNVKE